MKSEARFPKISISIERQDIPVAQMSASNVPDEKWRFVDKEGHGHFWDGKELPTLDWWVTGTYWLGDEYDGAEYEEGEWRCKICGETVKPEKKLEYGPSHIPGPTTIELTINEDQFVLSPEEYAKSVEDWQKAIKKRFPHAHTSITFSKF